MDKILFMQVLAKEAVSFVDFFVDFMLKVEVTV